MKLLLVALFVVTGPACRSHTAYSLRDANADGPLATPMQISPSPLVPRTPPGLDPENPLAPLFSALTSLVSDSNQAVECGTGVVCVPTYRFSGLVKEESARDLIAWLKKAEEVNAGAVVIEITTKGGSIDDGFKIIRAMEDFKKPIYCVADYETQSEGFALLESCTRRFMTKRTTLMTHKPYVTEVSGPLTIERLEGILEDLRATASAHAEICSHRLKITRAQYDTMVAFKDWSMDSEEALQVGAVDKVVTNSVSVLGSLRAGMVP